MTNHCCTSEKEQIGVTFVCWDSRGESEEESGTQVRVAVDIHTAYYSSQRD